MTSKETLEQERQRYRNILNVYYMKYRMGFKIRNIDEFEEAVTGLYNTEYSLKPIDSNYRLNVCHDSFFSQIYEIMESYNALKKQEHVKETKNTNPMKDRTPMIFIDENLKLSKFDGKRSNYPQFEQLFTLTYENECYQPHEQFIAFKNLIGEFGEGLMDGLQPTLEGLAIAKNLMKNKCLNPQNIKD